MYRTVYIYMSINVTSGNRIYCSANRFLQHWSSDLLSNYIDHPSQSTPLYCKKPWWIIYTKWMHFYPHDGHTSKPLHLKPEPGVTGGLQACKNIFEDLFTRRLHHIKRETFSRDVLAAEWILIAWNCNSISHFNICTLAVWTKYGWFEQRVVIFALMMPSWWFILSLFWSAKFMIWILKILLKAEVHNFFFYVYVPYLFEV